MVKPFSLSGRKRCDRINRKGMVWKGKTFQARFVWGVPKSPGQVLPPAGLYLGTFAPSSLSKKAVERNRMRRRCREAFRLHLLTLTEVPSLQLLICPRSSSLQCAFGDIADDVRTFFSSLPAWPPPAPPSPSSGS